MFVHSWQVFTLPKVRIGFDRLLDCCPKFDHWGTSEAIAAASSSESSGGTVEALGSTVWGCAVGSDQICLAWEWISIKPRVVAMGDPMTLFSNIDLVDRSGACVADAQRLLKLHEVIFHLPWQAYVSDARGSGEHRMAA